MREGWTYKSIGSLCDIKTGKLDANAASPNGLYPFFTCSRETLRIDNYAYDCECVLVAGNGELNAKYYEGKFNAYQRTYIITLKPDRVGISTKYLYCFFLKYVEKLRQKSIGGVIKYIKLGDLSNALIPVPDHSKQIEIVSELDLLSSVIEKQKAQIEELDKLAQSIFYDMFGDPVENEKGWEVKKLVQVSSKITNGNTPKGGSDVYIDEGILFFRSQNVWRNRIDLDDIAYIDEETHKKLHNSSLMHNDILITKTGRFNTENSSLGRASLYEGTDNEANINGHVYLVRLKSGMIHKFVLYILISNSFRDLIRRVCVGGIDKRQLNKNHIEDFPIIIPPLSLQQEFAQKIQAIESMKAKVRQSLKESETLFNSRMDFYFS